MEEFLLNNYMIITHSVEAMAALTGLFLLKKYKNTTTRYFIYFLLYISLCEFLARYTKFVHPDKFLHFLIGTVFEKNHWLATLYWKIGAIIFFAFFYNKVLESEIFKKILKKVSLFFLIISVMCILFNWDAYFYRFFPIISISGAVVIFLCTVFYFIETLNSNRILTFYKTINFYISAAIFIWWLIITPLVFYDVYFTYEIGNPNRDWSFLFLRWQIYMFANIVMYITFTLALIWCKPQKN